ncbi:MAG: hypothetical protein ACD_60C00059G0001 [uncultured bacterium]|nr:MAG: hypothetical protein ACD_60C00059G0001 [uncultured bacterium]
MILRTFITLIILISIIVGFMTVAWREQIVHLIIFRDFFDVSLPILGFGALIKYLCTCSSCSCGCCSKNKK